MTYKCLKAVAFCFCWGFRKASSSQKMQTVIGCLENSDLETSDLRPQTSKLQTSKTQTSKLQTP